MVGQDVNRKERLGFLALLNQARGAQSTGFAWGETRARVVKRAVSAQEFLRSKRWRALRFDGGWVIGHTRLATRGAISRANAHPFTVGQYTGVHNGIVYNDWDIEETEGICVAVDSQVIWHLFDKYGVADGCTRLDGTFALAWHKRGESAVYLLRHKMPLAIAKGGAWMYFSSELEDLRAVLGDLATYSHLAEDEVVQFDSSCLVATTIERVEFAEFSEYSWFDYEYVDYCEFCGCATLFKYDVRQNVVRCTKCGVEYKEVV